MCRKKFDEAEQLWQEYYRKIDDNTVERALLNIIKREIANRKTRDGLNIESKDFLVESRKR